MNRICRFVFVFGFLLALVSALALNVQAQEFTITEGGPYGLTLGVPNGDTVFASLPDLTPEGITVANDTRLFVVFGGDFLSNDTISSFQLLVGNGLETGAGLDSLPLGESFIGFASGFADDPDLGLEFDFYSIGYARVLRTTETLELVSTDSVFAGFAAEVDPSFGITVPVPEPASTLLGTLGLIAMGFRRDRC